MSKNKFFLVLFVIVASISIIAGVLYFSTSTDGKINKGSFRISDAVLKSNVYIEQKQGEAQITELSNMVLDVSQCNELMLYLIGDVDVDKITVGNIKCSNPKRVGSINFYQKDNESVVNLNDFKEEYEVTKIKNDNQYYIDLFIDNARFLTNSNVPSTTKIVKFDGTILELLNISFSDINFNISFNINIYDVTGKKNVCKVKLNLPSEEMMTNGVSIQKQDLSNYIFSVK